MERSGDARWMVAALRRHYGDTEPPEPRDPFALIVWENVGYLVNDELRGRIYRELEREVGIDPVAIAAAPPGLLRSVIAGGGMFPERRATRLRRAAELALEFAPGGLRSTLLALPRLKQRALLRKFPGIGDPGADKVLMFGGLLPGPAFESNGLRVLTRVGLCRERPSYAQTYREAVERIAGALDVKKDVGLRFFDVLRRHGRELCRRSEPLCRPCPLRSRCAYFARRAPVSSS